MQSRARLIITTLHVRIPPAGGHLGRQESRVRHLCVGLDVCMAGEENDIVLNMYSSVECPFLLK